jgi:mRNA-degrading endonuclease RelE of RelBE toxin-antitoxin system
MATSFVIRYDAACVADLKVLRQFERKRVLDEVDSQLSSRPAIPSRRRKLLTAIATPWATVRPVWQLRVGDFRVFYDVDEDGREVIVRAVRRKGTKTTGEVL